MGSFFADIHADKESQLLGAFCGIKDTFEIQKLREDKTYQGFLDLAKALRFQLRYRDAIGVCSEAIKLKQEEKEAYRQRAGAYLTTLQIENAREDFKRCRELGQDRLDVSYRLALCFYLQEEYEKAMEELEQTWKLCDDEMGIAVIFWHTLSAWKRRKKPALFLKYYRTDMKIGHHTAYAFLIETVMKERNLEVAEKRLENAGDLDFSIIGYGLYVYYQFLGMQEKAQTLLRAIIERDRFWISYGYLAAWQESIRQKEKSELCIH